MFCGFCITIFHNSLNRNRRTTMRKKSDKITKPSNKTFDKDDIPATSGLCFRQCPRSMGSWYLRTTWGQELCSNSLRSESPLLRTNKQNIQTTGYNAYGERTVTNCLELIDEKVKDCIIWNWLCLPFGAPLIGDVMYGCPLSALMAPDETFVLCHFSSTVGLIFQNIIAM